MKTKLLIMGVMLSAVLITLNHLTFGQDEEIPPVPVEKATAKAINKGEDLVVATQEDLAGIEEGEEDLITISLDSAPLSDVVRMFSRISGANIVAGTNLVGSVTVSMHDVPWEPALRAILDSVDLVLVEKTESIYSIVSKNDLAAEPVTIETMFLEYSSVSNVLPVVSKMLVSTNSSVSAFPSANALVVQETAQRLNEIRQTVRKIDVPRAQVYIETKFIELNDSAIEDLGLDWQVLQGYTVTAGNIGGGYQRTKTRATVNEAALQQSNSDSTSILRSSNRNNVQYDSSGTYLDPNTGSPVTASVSGRNALLSFTPATTAGGGDNAQPGTAETYDLGNVVPALENVSGNAFESLVGSAFTKGLSISDMDDISQFYGATLGASDLAVTLSALKQNDGVDVVSNPKIIVANGETATIHVGRNEPNVTAKPQGDTGDRFAIALDEDNPYIEIGVKLEVTPTVNNKDNIGLHIVPELSRKIGDLQVGVVGVSYPITQIRRIETEFQLPSGRTVAIGGLTETRDAESINKVPLLGDLPVIGKYLFTHKHMEQVQDEVVIFVTVGLAESKDLVEVSGIPGEGELIHRHLANKALEQASQGDN